MTKPVKNSRFPLTLLLYALALMAVCAVLLLVFHRYMDAYEATRSQLCVDAYSLSLKSGLPAAAQEALNQVEADPASREEALRLAEDLVQGAALVKDYVNSIPDEKLVYRLRAEDGHAIGTVTFAVTGKGSFGLPIWEKTEEHFDFSAYCKTLEVTVPAGYRVYLGERLLGQEAVTEELPYEILEECYLHYENLPMLLHYVTPPFLGEMNLRVLDPQGGEHSTEELTEEQFLDNVSPEIREQAEGFLSKMIPAYVLFTADIQGRAKDYFNPLMNYVVSGSQLHTRMLQALENAGWGKTQTLKVTSIHVNFVMDLGDGRYLADVTYDYDLTTVWGGAAQMTDNARVVILDLAGTLKADAVYHY